jgi:hypothetical protein
MHLELKAGWRAWCFGPWPWVAGRMLVGCRGCADAIGSGILMAM